MPCVAHAGERRPDQPWSARTPPAIATKRGNPTPPLGSPSAT